MNSESKQCQNCKNSFVIEPEDFLFYEKIHVPPPTFCPECRLIRRLAWRNERALYHRECGFCKNRIISMYRDDTPTVYCRDCWYSDKWEGSSYAREYDYEQPFFKQWSALFHTVPLLNLWLVRENIASDYNNYAGNNKNSYLSYSVVNCENVAYSWNIDQSKDCFDSVYLKESELCYENLDCSNNYRSFFMLRSRNCMDSAFLFDCVNCQNCFLSYNLRNKQYVIENKQYSKEAYFTRLQDFGLDRFSNIQVLRERFWEAVSRQALHKFANIVKSVNAIGDNILNSKNVKSSFDVYGAEDIRYSARILEGTKDIHSCYGVAINELIYEGTGTGFNNYGMAFGFFTDASSEIYYSVFCLNSHNLFACVGLRNKSYCILNKQYTKEEYERLVPKIIEHMNTMPYIDKKGRIYKYGEFFPLELSPFGYNETIAQEYFPLTKEQAIEQGYSWKDPEERNYKIQIPNDQIPDHIKDVKDDIVGQVIECAHAKSQINADQDADQRGLNISANPPSNPRESACGEQCTEAFKIIPQELAFYRKMNLPLPRLCPNCRHYQRIKQRNPLKLWHRKCECQGQKSKDKGQNQYTNTATHFHGQNPCPNEFETSYAPERSEIVYCESCYNSEVI